jgi:hypothetical protein
MNVEAEEMSVQALRGYEKACGLEHTLTLYTVNSLGLLYKDQGRMAELATTTPETEKNVTIHPASSSPYPRVSQWLDAIFSNPLPFQLYAACLVRSGCIDAMDVLVLITIDRTVLD